jgi:N12 class adenine-specific DNA methylase
MADQITLTRPWVDLSKVGLRALHTKDGQGRHLIMLAPLNPDEDESVSSARIEGFQDRLSDAVKKLARNGLQGNRYKNHLYVLTGESLRSFRGIYSTLKTAFPEASLNDDVPVHLISLPRYIQYRSAQVNQEENNEVYQFIDSVQAELPEGMTISEDGDFVTVTLADGQISNFQGEQNDKDGIRETVEKALNRFVDEFKDASAADLIDWQTRLKAQRETTRYNTPRQWVSDTQRERVDLLIGARADDLYHQFHPSSPLDSLSDHKIAELLPEFSAFVDAGSQTLKGHFDALEAERAKRAQPSETSGPSLDDLIEMRDAAQEQMERQGRIADSRLMDKVRQLNKTIAELEKEQYGESETDTGTPVNGPVEPKWTPVGVNADGDELVEDEKGVRAIDVGGILSVESVSLDFTRYGVDAHVANRKDLYRTTEELAARQGEEVTAGDKIREAFESNVAYQLGEWIGITVTHNGESQQFLVCQKVANPDDGTKPILSLTTVAPGKSGTGNEGELVVHSQKLGSRNQQNVVGLPRPIWPEFRQLWEKAGLNLPSVQKDSQRTTVADPYAKPTKALSAVEFIKEQKAIERAQVELDEDSEALMDEKDQDGIYERTVELQERETEAQAGRLLFLVQDKPLSALSKEDRQAATQMSEFRPALAEALTKATGILFETGPRPKTKDDLVSLLENLKAEGGDAEMLRHRVADVESAISLADSGVSPSGWGNVQYLNRVSTGFGAFTGDMLVNETSYTKGGENGPGSSEPSNAAQSERDERNGSDLESSDGSGQADAQRGSAGSGDGRAERDGPAQTDASGDAGLFGADGQRGGDLAEGAGAGGAESDGALRGGTGTGSEADAPGDAPGRSGQVRAGDVGGAADGSSEAGAHSDPGSAESDADRDAAAAREATGTGREAGQPVSADSEQAQRADDSEPNGPEQSDERRSGSERGETVGNRAGDGSDRDTSGQSQSPALAGFRFEPDHDAKGKTRGKRVADNLEALKTLFQLDEEERAPTSDEIAVLAEYSGWGGIDPNLFGYSSNKPGYAKEAEAALTDYTRTGKLNTKEWQSLRSTILNAHYTHSGVIRPMWGALERMGVPTKRILEPSCGLLNFKSYAPAETIAGSKFTAVEIDPLTARIAEKVHTDASVINAGLEDAKLADNFYDVAISNVPFGEYKVYDSDHPRWTDNIHNYFFKKSLEKIKPGGVIGFVTSSHTLDAQNDSVRKAIAEQAHFMGAVRLPTSTFEKNTQTQVMTDIIFLQKKGDFEPSYTPKEFIKTASVEAQLLTSKPVIANGEEFSPGEPVPATINEYFKNHPDQIIGDLGMTTSQFGVELTVRGQETSFENLEQLIDEGLGRLPVNVAMPSASKKSPSVEEVNEAQEQQRLGGEADDLMPGSIFYNEETGDFRRIETNFEGEKLVSAKAHKVPKNQFAKMTALIDLMGTARELLILQSQSETPTIEQQISEMRTELNEQYDSFVAKYGTLGDKKTEKLFRADPRAPFLYGLEDYDKETQEARKTAIFERRVVSPTVEAPTSAETPADALALSLAYTGDVSLSYIAELLKNQEAFNTEEKVQAHLLAEGLIFIDPESGNPVTRDTYLSENLKPKIEAAELAAQGDAFFESNVKALKDALPAPLKPSQIKVGIDAFWLPKDVINEFLSDHLGLRTTGPSSAIAVFDEVNRHWRMQSNSSKSIAAIARDDEQSAMHRWGTERAHVYRLLDNLFTHTQPIVRDKISNDPPQYRTNQAETLKAQGKFEEISDAFGRWVFKDPKRAKRLADIYNEKFNTWRLVEPDGSHMVYPGMAPSWVPRKHQNDFIWKAISGKNAMTSHVVGAGKTMQLIGTAIRGKQLGRWQKPIVVVPNHMLYQMAADAQQIYPSSRILILDKENISPAKRAEFVARCAMGDWDLVVCTHSSYSRIGVPKDFEANMLEEEKWRLESALINEQRQSNGGGRNFTERDIQKKIKNLEAKLKKTYDQMEKNRDNVLNLEEMGIDFMGVDEAHYYKNLQIDSAKQIPGVSTSESVRAWDMYMKCRYLQSHHGAEYGVMMATGTPISNSVVECYTFTRMMRPDLLRDSEINNFNDWMALFGEIKHNMEIKPEGGGYQVKSRLSRFKNVPELIKMIRTFIDFKSREDLNLPTPNVTHETVVAPQSETMKQFMKYIEARARDVRAGKEGSGGKAENLAAAVREALYGVNDKARWEGNILLEDDDMGDLPQDILLSIATDGRKASLDPRLIHPELEDAPDSKVNMCVQKVIELHEKFAADRATQMIFCDFSSPTGKGKFNVYDDIKAKLMKAGIPEEEIAFIHDAASDDAKEELFEKVRNGDVRVLLGSTSKMGVGTNVQDRLVAMHQLDPPWKPADIEQRLGRMDRQGNMFDDVFNFTYTTENSFDLFMWETLNRKLGMIQQAMRKPELAARELDEETELGFEDILAVTTGNPEIKDFIEARMKLDSLKRAQDAHLDEQADIGQRIEITEEKIRLYEAMIESKEKEKSIVQDNEPLHLELRDAIPGLQDGSASYIGGLKGLASALKDRADRVRAYRTETIGYFGGLELTVGKMSDEPSFYLMRENGEKDHIATVKTEKNASLVELLESNVDEDGEEKDPYMRVARKLAGRVRHIATGTSIEAIRENKQYAEENLAKIKEDQGRPFEREAELDEVRAKFQDLSERLGNVLDQDSEMDPSEIIDFAVHLKKDLGLDIQVTKHTGLKQIMDEYELSEPEETMNLA